MSYNFEQFFGALRRVALSDRERQNGRISLQAHMRAYPYKPVPAGLVSSALTRAGNFLERLLNSNALVAHPAFATAVLVLFIGVGTSFAAQTALPGEPLYAFKTRVNEPIQGALAFTPSAKAQWSAELTFRRLEEAEELAATGNLSTVASADIETGIEYAVANFHSSVKLLAADDDLGATSVQSDFEASLNAHEVVLSSLPTSAKTETARIATVVQKHADRVNKDRTAKEATLTATDTPAVKNAAINRKKSAEKAVNDAKKLSQKNLDMQIASSVESIALDVANDLRIGESEQEQGRWGKAYGAYQDAIRKAKETEKSVKTRSWLKSKFGIGFSSATTTDELAESAATSSATTTKDAKNSKDEDQEDWSH